MWRAMSFTALVAPGMEGRDTGLSAAGNTDSLSFRAKQANSQMRIGLRNRGTCFRWTRETNFGPALAARVSIQPHLLNPCRNRLPHFAQPPFKEMVGALD